MTVSSSPRAKAPVVLMTKVAAGKWPAGVGHAVSTSYRPRLPRNPPTRTTASTVARGRPGRPLPPVGVGRDGVPSGARSGSIGSGSSAPSSCRRRMRRVVRPSSGMLLLLPEQEPSARQAVRVARSAAPGGTHRRCCGANVTREDRGRGRPGGVSREDVPVWTAVATGRTRDGHCLQLARTVAAHHDGDNGLHDDHGLGHEIFQSSTMTALLDAVYDGGLTYGELARHGDFGVGTFNQLDGEMVAVAGRFFQLRSDGSANPVTPDELPPFADVTFFRGDASRRLAGPIDLDVVEALLDGLVPSTNLFYAVRI